MYELNVALTARMGIFEETMMLIETKLLLALPTFLKVCFKTIENLYSAHKQGLGKRRVLR